MKKTILLFAAAAFMFACKSKKSASTTSTDPTEVQLVAVKAKYPDATMETLKQGHALYYGTCTKCHGAKDIASRDMERWPGIIESMAKKAGISETEKDAVLKYVTSVKLAAK